MDGIITINDSRYPSILRSIKDAPKQLYYKGNWPADGEAEIFENCLAVVGSRRMTTYGKQIAQKLVSQIASAGLPAGRQGITIVSGFMYGIDATAHQACLDVGGRTIAVMPCGIDLITPDYQTKLYRDILENKGLVISEFEPDQKASNWTFPVRNKIVAGLSKAVLVVEAGEKSGSLITAKLALKYNRKLFAVPGPLTSVLSKGTTQLIKEGAEIVSCAEDIVRFYNVGAGLVPARINEGNHKGLPLQDSSNMEQDSSNLEQRIIQELQSEAMEIDVLSRILGKSVSELGSAISMMQIRGLVHQENGKYYVC